VQLGSLVGLGGSGVRVGSTVEVNVAGVTSVVCVYVAVAPVIGISGVSINVGVNVSVAEEPLHAESVIPVSITKVMMSLLFIRSLLFFVNGPACASLVS